jgi:HAD superfamily hydrolase (TIGR01509 family)
MIRAIFFDLDDTLCDARPAFRAGRDDAFQALLARWPDLDRARVCATWERVNDELFVAVNAGTMLMAGARRERFRRTLRALDRADDAFADQLDLLLGETQLRHLALFPDAAVLDTLRGQVRTGIITNGAGDAHPDSQRTKAAHLRLLDRVEGIWISDEMGARKPDPHAFWPACRALGLAPGACLFVGDSLTNDIAGATSAGMRTALIRRDGAPFAPAPGDPRPSAVLAALGELPRMVAAAAADPDQSL